MFEFVFALGRVLATRLAGASRAVLANVSGIAESEATIDSDSAEGSADEPLFGALGLVGRPLPPDTDGACEVLAAKTEDGLRPIVVRDLRINAKVNPKSGEVALAHYGGGFLSLAYPDKSGTTAVLYAPGAGGAKAHALILDPTPDASSISLVHGDGLALWMTGGAHPALVLKNADGTQIITLDDTGIALAGKVKLVGAALAGDPNAGQPVALAPALLAWAGQMQAALVAIAAKLNAAGPVIGAPGTVTVPAPTPASGTWSASVLKASPG